MCKIPNHPKEYSTCAESVSPLLFLPHDMLKVVLQHITWSFQISCLPLLLHVYKCRNEFDVITCIREWYLEMLSSERIWTRHVEPSRNIPEQTLFGSMKPAYSTDRLQTTLTIKCLSATNNRLTLSIKSICERTSPPFPQIPKSYADACHIGLIDDGGWPQLTADSRWYRRKRVTSRELTIDVFRNATVDNFAKLYTKSRTKMIKKTIGNKVFSMYASNKLATNFHGRSSLVCYRLENGDVRCRTFSSITEATACLTFLGDTAPSHYPDFPDRDLFCDDEWVIISKDDAFSKRLQAMNIQL